jgi:hypothetical protein
MRSAETVLGVIRERGNKGLPLEDIYRQLFNRTSFSTLMVVSPETGAQ